MEKIVNNLNTPSSPPYSMQKITPLARKEKRKIHSPFSSFNCPLFSKATMFYSIYFAQC
jgi:hypothetical protein